MPNAEQFEAIKWGTKAWNDWRRKNKDREVDLAKAELEDADLSGAYLHRANLREAKLSRARLGRARLMDADLWEADLSNADLRDANLRGANLRGANLELALLSGADLRHADLRGANLGWATLVEANLYGANMAGADFTETTFNDTILANVNLAGASNLEDTVHLGTSSIDESSLMQSGRMPLQFLEGVGLSEAYLEYLPAIREAANPIQFFSCFIAYAHKDRKFVQQLQQILRDKGIRVWLDERSPKDAQRDEPPIDQSLRIWDKTLLCCSVTAKTQGWIPAEIELAQKKEEQTFAELGKKVQMLVPFAVDKSIFQGSTPWESELVRRIGADFSNTDVNAGLPDGEVNKLVRLVRGY